MGKKVALAAALVVATATGAMAADQTNMSSPGAVDWSGFYVGAQVMYGGGNSDWHFPGFSEPSPSGFAGGGYVGWNFQNGHFVFGPEFEYNFSGIDDTVPCPNPTYSCSTDIRSFGSVRGRFGGVVQNWLIYGQGGLAIADIKSEAVPPAGGFSGSETYTGWTVGAGVEYMFPSSKWSGRAEYSYYDFGDETVGVSGPNVGVTLNTVRIGITRHF